jgi:hypothetical protein
MKTTVFVAVLLGAGIVARADEFTGYLADAKCAAAGKAGSAAHAECSKKCVTAGEKIVLVGEDGKILQIKNQDKVQPHVGHKVTLNATREGDALTVEGGKHLD